MQIINSNDDLLFFNHWKNKLHLKALHLICKIIIKGCQKFFCNFDTILYSQALCKDLHQKIDVVDEERYDIAAKVSKNEKEVLHHQWNHFVS